MNKDLTFDIKVPTKKFKNSIHELKTKNGKSFKTTDELFKDLDASYIKISEVQIGYNSVKLFRNINE